jgi:hypothetical protein
VQKDYNQVDTLFGLFHLASMAENRFPGVLKVSASYAELTILIAGNDYLRDLAFPDPDARFQFIGLTHEAEFLTLVDCAWGEQR